MRKTNRRLVIADRKEREMRREYHRPPMRAAKIQQLAFVALTLGLFRKWISDIGNLFGGIFNPPTSAIRNLSLTRKSVFEEGQRRDAGAAYLRGIWGNLQGFKMRSTRDGKQV